MQNYLIEIFLEYIFEKLFSATPFEDRYLKDKHLAIDVIIPLGSSTKLFEANCLNFYKTIPINNLIVGTFNPPEYCYQVLKKFPRVKIHKIDNIHSIGYAIKYLIELTTTQYFIYLHSDVYLTDNWFDEMYKEREKYDFYESGRRYSVLIDYDGKRNTLKNRAYSGSQMGSSIKLKKYLEEIEDDYLFRNEDIIIQNLILQKGGSYGLVNTTFHHHQITNKDVGKSIDHLNISNFEEVIVKRKANNEWDKFVTLNQIKGIIKYINPKHSHSKYLIKHFFFLKKHCIKNKFISRYALLNFIIKENKFWLKYFFLSEIKLI